MKILAIRGENLASLQAPFALELERAPLATAGIFAITGPVGAGKSTLLDALCLPLFDRTPRLTGKSSVRVGDATAGEEHWLGERDPRTLLRREAMAGFAEVDFRGRDGVRYRARWSVRRARRGSGRLQQQELALHDLDRGHVVSAGSRSEVLAAIQARLGLDFAQFCRSVLLAQGEFAAFLRAKPEERAKLLETLTGADVYRRLSKAAHERARSSQHQVEVLRSQMEVQQPLAVDERTALERTEQALVQEHAFALEGIRLALRYVTWHQAAEQHRLRESQAVGDLQQAQRAFDAAATRRELLARRQRAVAVVPRWEMAVAARDAVARCRAVAATTAAGLAQATERAAVAQRRFAATFADLFGVGPGDAVPAVVRELAHWEPLLQQWEQAELAAAAAVAAGPEREAAVVAADANLVALEPRLQEVARVAERAKEALVAAQAAVGAIDGEALHERRLRLDERARQHASLRAVLVAWQGAMQAWTTAGAALATARQAAATAAAGLPMALVQQQAAIAATAAATRSLDAARTRAGLHGLREQLVDGEACPLCGSHEHPAAHAGGDAAQRLLAAEQALAQCRSDETKATQQVAALEAKVAAAQDAVGQAEASVAARRRELERARGGVPGADGEEPAVALAALAAEHAADEAAMLELARDERRARDATTALHKASTIAADAERQVQATTVAHGAAVAALRSAQERLAELQRALAGARQRGDDAAAALAGACAGVVDGLERLRAVGGARRQRLRIVHDDHRAWSLAATAAAAAAKAHAEAERAVAQALADEAGAGKALERMLAIETLELADVEAAARLGPDELAAEARALDELATEVARRRAVVSDRHEQRKAQEDHDRPSLDAAEAEAALQDARTAADVLEKRLQDVRSRRFADDQIQKHRAELQPRLDAAEAAAATWLALDELIGSSTGDAFAVFAQEMTLDLLLLEANRRLCELARRYRLRRNPVGELDFVVVDLDLGETTRSVWTLSGGETFLVSLALALALATLAAPKSRVETLFLDEGFGTLDAQALETALGALDSLQALGCQVGVISHVDGIAERIGVQVAVQPEGGGKSRVVAQVP
ncbi:MAG: AAA family ATPase [Planctomycetes bacterium]|nr:AAA family ATPase [Planctomycetota bacterium]